MHNTEEYAEYLLIYPTPPPARWLCTIIGPGGICKSRFKIIQCFKHGCSISAQATNALVKIECRHYCWL